MLVRVIWKSRLEEFPLASPTTIFFSILRNRISHKCAAKKTRYENIGKGGCRGPFWGALGVTKLDTHAFCCYPSQTLSHLSWSNKTLPSPFHLRHPDDIGVGVWTHCKQIVCLSCLFVCLRSPEWKVVRKGRQPDSPLLVPHKVHPEADHIQADLFTSSYILSYLLRRFPSNILFPSAPPVQKVEVGRVAAAGGGRGKLPPAAGRLAFQLSN